VPHIVPTLHASLHCNNKLEELCVLCCMHGRSDGRQVYEHVRGILHPENAPKERGVLDLLILQTRGVQTRG
jgi:hypothetical protein